MKTSEHGLGLLAGWEGEVDHVYPDQAGIPTIGVGHRLRPGESFPNGITHEQALEILSKDVATAEAGVNADVKVPLSQNQFDATVSFTFNDGCGALAKSTLLQLLNEGNYAGAAAHFTDWDHISQGGKLVVSEALLNRRRAEAALFLTPDAPAAPVADGFPVFP